MIFVIDSGNTNIVMALFAKDNLQASIRISTNQARTEDEYYFIVRQFLADQKTDISSIEAVVISNVVPQIDYALASLCKKYFNLKPFIVGDKNLKLGLTIKIDNPNEVGSDRLVNAAEAFRKYQDNCIIIDFGTATNFDIITKNGEYIGGVLAPGVQLSLNSLYQAAAKLPQVSIVKPEKIIGKSTITAMQSGIYWGYVSMVQGIISRIQQELSQECSIIATGGLASLIFDGTGIIGTLEPNLTIYGLKYIYELNK